jgi:hypothetical protein
MPEAAEIDFEPPRLDKLHEVPDLSIVNPWQQ